MHELEGHAGHGAGGGKENDVGAKGTGDLGVGNGLEHGRVTEERELLDDNAPLARLQGSEELLTDPALEVRGVAADKTLHGHASAL